MADFKSDENQICLHFAHANSYPPDCYRQFLKALENHHQVVAMKQRPLWQSSSPKDVNNWNIFAQDLIQFLESQIKTPVYGVGHSMGAIVTLIAAIQRPDLFQKIILIEPPILSLQQFLLMRFTPSFFKSKIPLLRRTLNRPDLWHNKQEAYEFHRSKKVFSRFSDDVLWDYIDYGIEEKRNQKVGLVYSKTWEVRCYETVPYFWKISKQSNQPILGIRGELSRVISSDSWEKWKKNQGQNKFIEIPNVGHLIPFEKPKFLAKIITNFLLHSSN